MKKKKRNFQYLSSYEYYVYYQSLKDSDPSLPHPTYAPKKSIEDQKSEILSRYYGDAFSKEIREKLTSHGPFDAIISDVAPMTTGNRTVDTTRSEYLAEQVVYLAQEQLKTHGNLVIKIFQGGGQQKILQDMRSMFSKAKTLKPKACRTDSFEIYLIGLDKK